MDKKLAFPIPKDIWRNLSRFTTARIALGHSGMSLPTNACLAFSLDHALARDAVNIPLDFADLGLRLKNQGYSSIMLQSQADSHRRYLQRPDLGRSLSESSVQQLQHSQQESADAVVVVADGLSSKAIAQHAEPFLALLIPELQICGYTMSPIFLVKHGRVAIGDAVAQHYNARFCIVLIGERPGLSSPDSMGIYFTYRAQAGISTDANRNCISNIHSNGLSYLQALKKLLFLFRESEKLQLSGVGLKDETADEPETRRLVSCDFLGD